MPRSPLALLTFFKAIVMLIVGVAAAGFSWLACSRFALAAGKQDIDLATLGEPAHTMLSNPPLAAAPGVAIALLALAGLMVPRVRIVLLLLATLLLLADIGLMVGTLLQFLGPMYEYRPL